MIRFLCTVNSYSIRTPVGRDRRTGARFRLPYRLSRVYRNGAWPRRSTRRGNDIITSLAGSDSHDSAITRTECRTVGKHPTAARTKRRFFCFCFSKGFLLFFRGTAYAPLSPRIRAILNASREERAGGRVYRRRALTTTAVTGRTDVRDRRKSDDVTAL